MQSTVDISSDGSRQTIRLPEHIHLAGTTVTVRQDTQTGNVILSPMLRNDWDSFFQLLEASGPVEEAFMQGIEDPVTTPEDIF